MVVSTNSTIQSVLGRDGVFQRSSIAEARLIAVVLSLQTSNEADRHKAHETFVRKNWDLMLQTECGSGFNVSFAGFSTLGPANLIGRYRNDHLKSLKVSPFSFLESELDINMGPEGGPRQNLKPLTEFERAARQRREAIVIVCSQLSEPAQKPNTILCLDALETVKITTDQCLTDLESQQDLQSERFAEELKRRYGIAATDAFLAHQRNSLIRNPKTEEDKCTRVRIRFEEAVIAHILDNQGQLNPEAITAFQPAKIEPKPHFLQTLGSWLHRML